MTAQLIRVYNIGNRSAAACGDIERVTSIGSALLRPKEKERAHLGKCAYERMLANQYCTHLAYGVQHFCCTLHYMLPL